VDGVLCGAQTHKCPKEGSNRSVQNLRFQGRGLLTIDPCLISNFFRDVRCGRVCAEKVWMVCRAAPKSTNAKARARTRVSGIFDSRDVVY